jgi:hypothetical protein
MSPFAKLVASYRDWIDTCAYNNVEDYSGRDVPYLHTFVVWVAVGIFAANVDAQKTATIIIFIIGLCLWTGWVLWIMIFYRKAKVRHRLALGIPDWREKMEQDAAERND